MARAGVGVARGLGVTGGMVRGGRGPGGCGQRAGWEVVREHLVSEWLLPVHNQLGTCKCQVLAVTPEQEHAWSQGIHFCPGAIPEDLVYGAAPLASAVGGLVSRCSQADVGRAKSTRGGCWQESGARPGLPLPVLMAHMSLSLRAGRHYACVPGALSHHFAVWVSSHRN